MRMEREGAADVAVQCSSGKRAYREKAEAKVALRVVRSLRRHERQMGVARKDKPEGERQVYRCPECRCWHLTSQRRV